MDNRANLPANNGGNTTYYNSDNIHYTQFGGTLLTPVMPGTDEKGRTR